MKKYITILGLLLVLILSADQAYATDYVKETARGLSTVIGAVTAVAGFIIATPIFIVGIIGISIKEHFVYKEASSDNKIELCQQAKQLYFEDSNSKKWFIRRGIIQNGISYVILINNKKKIKVAYSDISSELYFKDKTITNISKDNIIDLCPSLKNSEVNTK